MKYKVILIAVLSIFLMTGCTGKDQSNLLMDGRKALEDGSYEVAINKLSSVLEGNSEDSEARGLYIQAYRLNNAQKFEEQSDYKQAIDEIKSLLDQNVGSSQVNSEAKEMLKKLEKDYDKLQKDEATRKRNAKLAAGNNKEKVQSEARSQGYTYDASVYRSRTSYQTNKTNTSANGNAQNAQGQNAQTGQNGQQSKWQGQGQQQQSGWQGQQQQSKWQNQGQQQSKWQGQSGQQSKWQGQGQQQQSGQ